ncbi:MAG: hypothetical protein AAF493_06980 [Pseudomonadota bacterium]
MTRAIRAALVSVWLGTSSCAMADETPKTLALEGTLVDLQCFARERVAAAQGQPIPDCGPPGPTQPIGLVIEAQGGEALYVLATPPGVLIPHLGRTARLNGPKSPLGDVIKPDKLEVKTPDGWTDIQLLPDM